MCIESLNTEVLSLRNRFDEHVENQSSALNSHMTAPKDDLLSCLNEKFQQLRQSLFDDLVVESFFGFFV